MQNDASESTKPTAKQILDDLVGPPIEYVDEFERFAIESRPPSVPPDEKRLSYITKEQIAAFDAWCELPQEEKEAFSRLACANCDEAYKTYRLSTAAFSRSLRVAWDSMCPVDRSPTLYDLKKALNNPLSVQRLGQILNTATYFRDVPTNDDIDFHVYEVARVENERTRKLPVNELVALIEKNPTCDGIISVLASDGDVQDEPPIRHILKLRVAVTQNAAGKWIATPKLNHSRQGDANAWMPIAVSAAKKSLVDWNRKRRPAKKLKTRKSKKAVNASDSHAAGEAICSLLNSVERTSE